MQIQVHEHTKTLILQIEGEQQGLNDALVFIAHLHTVWLLVLFQTSTLTPQKRGTNKHLQLVSFLNLALVPLRSLSLLEATTQRAGDSEYHVREQVGPDSGPGGPAPLAS